MSNLLEALDKVVDHRKKQGKEYRLSSLLLLVLCGFMCGCNSLLEVHRFAKRLNREQREKLGFLWFKVPSHSAICVTFQGVDVVALEQTLSQFMLQDAENTAMHIMVDGKNLRGSKTSKLPKGAMMLACFSDILQAVIGQKPTAGGYDEVTSAIDLLKSLPLKNAIVTGDAMFADRHFCETVVAGGGNYILPVKNNQPSLKTAISKDLDKKNL